MTDVDAALRTQLRNIETTYGHPVQHWFDVIDSSLTKHNQVVAMLKADHGLAHGAAHRLSLLARDRAATAQNPAPEGSRPDAVAGLYAGRKGSLLPLHDQLMAIIQALGDFDVVPKKGYLSLRRRRQFAMIQPTAAGRIDLGLVLPGLPPDGRLEAAGNWNALFTHRVRITDAADLDGHLRHWLSAAYAAAA